MHFHGVYETRMIVFGRVNVLYESIRIHVNLFLQHINRAPRYMPRGCRFLSNPDISFKIKLS